MAVWCGRGRLFRPNGALFQILRYLASKFCDTPFGLVCFAFGEDKALFDQDCVLVLFEPGLPEGGAHLR